MEDRDANQEPRAEHQYNQMNDADQAEQGDCSTSASSSHAQHVRQSTTIPVAVARYVITPAKYFYVPKITTHNIGTPTETELNICATGECGRAKPPPPTPQSGQFQSVAVSSTPPEDRQDRSVALSPPPPEVQQVKTPECGRAKPPSPTPQSGQSQSEAVSPPPPEVWQEQTPEFGRAEHQPPTPFLEKASQTGNNVDGGQSCRD